MTATEPRPPGAPPDGARPPTTRAVGQRAYGPPDGLRLTTVPRPSPGPGEVLLEVRAAGVDRGVWHLVTGRPYLMRVLGFGLRRPARPVPGRDVAGVVREVGPGVTDLAPGEEVVGFGAGAFAEHCLARADQLVPRPASLDPVHAAALPVSGVTALQAVRDRARVRPGQRVLVLGASGGVGSFAVQVAADAGAHVTGVASGARTELVRSLGADEVVDRAQRDPLDGSRRYDVVVDTGGSRPLRHLRRALAPRGVLVVVGGEGGGRLLGGVDRGLRAALWSLVSRRTMGTFVAAERQADVRELVAMAADGRLAPAVTRTYPLERAAEAVRDLELGRVRGKAVLEVAP
ncbi:NAD(P)-dependent alcohol dehydrogenase [Pseudokineococcus sp. 5B2Z-1]|uniref:NAD(P)-dependent alcohol dehydrogenase n=1 Tax=Pseudokineococcus sp. 5B2Z-1 TaxID=3132744 RepID=UPI0030AF6AC9